MKQDQGLEWGQSLLPAGLVFACLVSATLLNYLVPLPIIEPWQPAFMTLVGCVFLFAVILGVACFRVFKQSKTPIDFGKPAQVLITQGPYCYSRNPLYVATLLFITALALIMGHLWAFLAIPIVFLLFNLVLIRKEERHLEVVFGDEYRSYKARVRRWF